MKEETKERLVKHLNFLEQEINDWELYRNITWEIYQKERSKRREVERWIENIINSSIDISKLILEYENLDMPETYREIVISLSLIEDFDKENIQTISKWVRLRNILAHEYLDIRWNSIKKFIKEGEKYYRNFLEEVKKYLKKRFK